MRTFAKLRDMLAAHKDLEEKLAALARMFHERRLPQPQGLKDEALVFHRECFTTQRMERDQLARRVKNVDSVLEQLKRRTVTIDQPCKTAPIKSNFFIS
jgi:hypothetical protein